MARGIRSPPPASALPKIQFAKIKDDISTQPNGVHDGQARSFGYNDFSDFRRPDYYIRHIEPLEIDLARQVEYDMDEQDQEWLEAVNTERKKEQIDKVTYETFEIIMDRLEKEWFDLTKNLPKPDLAMPSEDSTCAICDDSEGENSNAIVFCDGCNLAVHQDCYGVPYIPEGQWLCRKCTVSPENPVQCFLCPNEGGAFKQTIHGDWVHLLCAIWVPETRVANEVFMEPITGVEKISKQRWKLKCSICDVREGACIQCAKATCFVAFHATCARQEKLLLPMKSTQGSEPVTLQAYCERHLPKEQQDIRALALENEAKQVSNTTSKLSSKSARAYNKTYKPGPPIVPAAIVNRIISYINKIKIRKRPEFVQMVCRYWSLKREARRGAPLLKRLHLEPWTASAGGKMQTEEEMVMKLDQLRRLRQDLENVKMLTGLTRKREQRKLRQTEIIHKILSDALFPHEGALRLAFERIMAIDRNDYFKNPVNKNEVPDYFDIVLNPMCWSIIDSRLDKHEYWDVQNDIDLVIDNAILYNKPGTAFYKTATRIYTAAKPILDDLERQVAPQLSRSTNAESSDANQSSHLNILPPVGDLEPPLDILELLVSSNTIQDDLNIELETDPLTSLFNYEVARFKPPPPPSPIMVPRPRKHKPKRDRKAEHERSKARKEVSDSGNEKVEMKVEADSDIRMLEFHIPRTRRALAAAAAFEAEAHGQTPAESSGASMEPTIEWQGSKLRLKKRVSVTPVSQAAVPQVVEDVDNRGSFHMFNAGWILPADYRRGGRAPVEKQMLPPPKKRLKTDHGTSRLSVVSTAPSENQTLRSVSPASNFGNPDESMDVDEPDASTNQPFPPETPFSSGVISRTSTDASGRVIIEELDTPFTRRQKLLRRKAEKEKLLREASGAAPGSASAGPSSKFSVSRNPQAEDNEAKEEDKGKGRYEPGMEKQEMEQEKLQQEKEKKKDQKGKPRDDDTESELSELSETPSEERNEEGETSRSAKPARKKGKEPASRSRKSSRFVNYDSGTLVWAKAESYPWWPAVVFDADHPEVPSNVVREYNEFRQRRKIKLYIVRFYDKYSKWQYLPRDKLQLLGEDFQLDNDMLAPQSRLQKWKSPQMRQSCREAFRTACAEMETKSDQESEFDQEPETEAA